MHCLGLLESNGKLSLLATLELTSFFISSSTSSAHCCIKNHDHICPHNDNTRTTNSIGKQVHAKTKTHVLVGLLRVQSILCTERHQLHDHLHIFHLVRIRKNSTGAQQSGNICRKMRILVLLHYYMCQAIRIVELASIWRTGGEDGSWRTRIVRTAAVLIVK